MLKPRILLVDADEGFLGIYSRLLNSAGHDVFTATSGAEALNLARRCRPDLVLLNVSLPDLDGIELCRSLKAGPAWNHPQTLLFTNSVDYAESLSLALGNGADDYLAFPVTNGELLARVQVQLRLKQVVLLLEREMEAHLATQAELRQSESTLRLISESIEDVLWMIKPSFDQTVYVSPAYETIWGRARHPLYRATHTYLETVHPEDRERVSAVFADLSKGICHDHEYRILRPDGSLRWIHERAFPVYDAGGNLSLVAGVSRDITLSKELQNQATLLESEAILRELAENLHQVIWLRNRDRMLYVNPAYEECWGLSRESIYEDGSSFMSRVHPEDQCRVRHAFLEEHGGEVIDEEFRIIRPDGVLRWLRASAVPIREAGKVVRIVGITQDITAQKVAEESLRISGEKLRQGEEHYRVLAGRLIHAQEEERRRLARELHDDLTQRIAYLAIEAGRLEGEAWALPPEFSRKLRELREYAAELADDVNSLSRLIHPAVLYELGLIEAVRSECRKFEVVSEITVHFNSTPSFREPGKDTAICLYRLVQEGLRNIHKHARASNVSVSLDFRKDAHMLTITDDGIGFHSETVRKKGGLGLASMSERVDLAGGTLTIDARPGLGTVIRASIPH